MKLFVVLSALLAAGQVAAQVPTQVVVEHFTNSRCSVCAGQNPSFNQNLQNRPEVFRISYHPTSPYANCVFAQHNPGENDARTQFYNLYGSTPRLAINGNPISNSPNPYQNPNLYNAYLGQTSPLSVVIRQQKDPDTFRVQIVVRNVGSASGSLRLYAAAAEDTVFFTSPNGENRHYNVFRTSFFGPQGLVFDAPASGDSLVWESAIPRKAAWVYSRMFAYALVQNAGNRSLVQAGFTRPSDAANLTAVREVEPVSEPEVFPNPAESLVTVRLPYKAAWALRLTDLQGKLVQSFETSGGQQAGFAVKKSGVYFLEMRVGKKTWNRKLVFTGGK